MAESQLVLGWGLYASCRAQSGGGFNFSEAFWVSYKLFGGFGLTLLYMVLMFIYLGRKGYLKAPENRDL